MKKPCEQDMYAAVKGWFESSRKCVVVTADLATDKTKVRVERNARKRDIDVTALEAASDGLKVHLAEGKLLARGHSFEERLGQAESVKAYGDSFGSFSATHGMRFQRESGKRTSKRSAGVALGCSSLTVRTVSKSLPRR